MECYGWSFRFYLNIAVHLTDYSVETGIASCWKVQLEVSVWFYDRKVGDTQFTRQKTNYKCKYGGRGKTIRLLNVMRLS